LIDFNFTADPTSVEYEGRLYVYATNDQQQCDEKGPDSDNTYERIKSLAMMSTEDMVNWTWHGIINVEELAPWIYNSWAPSVTSRIEEDGKTHFYLYFSNSGNGCGVLTATSPVGPWTSPLEKSLVDRQTPGVEDCPHPFDPGVVIDDEGTGWLAFGGGGVGKIVKLGRDMISVASRAAHIPTHYLFEASELNYINDTYVYTYNIDWQDHSDWDKDVPAPTRCCMSYMTSKTPLVTDSWVYRDNYFKNPGECGFDYSNNHTHLHKYKGRWYILYHSMSLRHNLGVKGGYRNVSVEEIPVDENTLTIEMVPATYEGVQQIASIDPYALQQMETTAGTMSVKFEPYGDTGNMVACTDTVGSILVRGVEFTKKTRSLAVCSMGTGRIEVRENHPEGKLVAIIDTDSAEMSETKVRLAASPASVTDLCFLFKGAELKIDSWQFR
jgi:arabinoxylan arabinofuranohydrolase